MLLPQRGDLLLPAALFAPTRIAARQSLELAGAASHRGDAQSEPASSAPRPQQAPPQSPPRRRLPRQEPPQSPRRPLPPPHAPPPSPRRPLPQPQAPPPSPRRPPPQVPPPSPRRQPYAPPQSPSVAGIANIVPPSPRTPRDGKRRREDGGASGGSLTQQTRTQMTPEGWALACLAHAGLLSVRLPPCQRFLPDHAPQHWPHQRCPQPIGLRTLPRMPFPRDRLSPAALMSPAQCGGHSAALCIGVSVSQQRC